MPIYSEVDIKQMSEFVIDNIIVVLVINSLPDSLQTNSYTILNALNLTTDNSTFMIIELDSRWVSPVNTECLLLLSTCSHLWYVQEFVLAHLFILPVIPTCISRLITFWYLGHFFYINVKFLSNT
jgi:hypothetical protein